MKKYKLIKEYPGSPNLRQIADMKDDAVYYTAPHPKYKSAELAIDKNWVENYPEYWEEVVDFWYVVLLKDGAFRNAWEVIKVQEDPSVLEHKKYFKSRAEAENFILYNKPCLSINDIGNNIPELTLERLIKNVKSKL